MPTSLSNITVKDSNHSLVIKSNDITIDGTSILGQNNFADKDLSNLSTIGQNILDSKLDTTQITNCITEIPQDIKLELNNGTLTLKAGSKVYVPNGFEADGTTPKFDTKIVESDISQTFGSTTNTCLIYLRQNNALAWYADSVSGTTPPTTGSFYNTALNKVQGYNGGNLNSDNNSFPFCLVTLSNGNVVSIDQVFNGFGYIGSTVFALPGVKGLIPNGRKADGSLKNIEVTVSNVILGSRNLTDVNIPIWLRDNKTLAFSNGIYYDEKSNLIANTTAKYCQIGVVDMSAGVITAFTSNTTFHTVDYNDFAPVKDSIPTKQDIATAVNYTNITNCITEIPQDIKLELNDGVLTLKAGSKVYVPNGAGVFDTVTIASDRTITRNSDGKYFITANNSGALNITAASGVSSGINQTPTAYNLQYNTTDNKIRRYYGSTDSYTEDSFPVAKVTVSNSAISSIDQVFNGFGYIGSTVFALPGVKGLIPNGRNTDGSLKNIEFVVSTVSTSTEKGTERDTVFFTERGINRFSKMSYNYDEDKNIYYTADNLPRQRCFIGSITGDITSFTPKTTFHAVDYNDFSDLKDNVEAKANDSDVVKLTGNQTIAGTKTFTGYIRYNTTANDVDLVQIAENADITLAPGNNILRSFRVTDKNGKILGDFRSTRNADGAQLSTIHARNEISGTQKEAQIIAAVNAQGSTYINLAAENIYSKTPATSDSSTKIATTANVDAKITAQAVKLTGDQTVAGQKTFNTAYTLFKGTHIDITNAKTTQNDVGINWLDKNGATLGQNIIRTYTTGSVQNNMYIKANNSNKWACISVGFDANDNAYTYAPTPSTTDNSTKIATTAFVNNKLQVVSALPASPDSSVFYFIPA